MFLMISLFILYLIIDLLLLVGLFLIDDSLFLVGLLINDFNLNYDITILSQSI